MIQDKIFFDEKDPTGLSYNTPFTFYGSYQGRLWSKSPSGSIQYYTQNSDLSAYATTGSNQFSGSQTITGSLTVTGTITGTVAGTTATASYVEYTNVANKPALVSGSSQVTYSGLTGIPSGIVSGSAQIASFGIFATTGSNGFNGSQSITGSLTVTGQVVAQTLNVQQVTSSIVYSSGSNVFGNTLGNTQQFTGSVSVTGSFAVTTTGTELQVTSTGVNLGNISTDNHNVTGSLLVSGSMNMNGAITSTLTSGIFLNNASGGTNATQIRINNTSGDARLGIESSTGGTIQVGTLAYAAIFGNQANNAVQFTTNGTARVTILNSGYMGIGTVDPKRGLHVSGTSAGAEFSLTETAMAVGAKNFNIVGNSTNGTWNLRTLTDNSLAQSVNFVSFLASTGAATFNSSVTAQGAKSQFVANGGDSAGAGISLNTGLSGTDRRNWYIGTEENISGDFAIKCSTSAGGSGNAGNTRLAILNNGNVGIGLTSPTGQLSIKNQISNGSNPVSSYAATNGVDGQNFFNGYYAENSDGLGSYPRYLDIVSIGSPDGSNGGSNIRFFTNPVATSSPAVERMRITSGGYLWVNGAISGFTGSQVQMQVNGQTRFGGDILLHNGSNAAQAVRLSCNGADAFNIQGSLIVTGTLAVDQTSASVIDHLTSKMRIFSYGAAGTTGTFEFRNAAGGAGSNLVATINASGVYTAVSDINKKKDFEDSIIGLDAILGLKPTLYRMRNDESEGEKELGFIAQEVKEFIPQAYVESGEEEEKFIGLNYNPIVAALVKAIQELKAEIQTLKQQ